MKPQVKLSPSEQRLLNLLPVKGEIDTNMLLKKYYKGKKEIPFHARGIIIGLVRSLTIKGQVMRSERAGPIPMKIWRTRQGSKAA